MATYAIGDIQGCYQTLTRLLDRIRFDPARDRLWTVGDLVNRRRSSLQVLRWARSLGEGLTTVLGNHDLHLLARAEGVRARKRRDTLEGILAAPDREDLLDWLRTRPLFHEKDGWVLVHAGLLPGWTVEKSRSLAQEVEEALQSTDRPRFLETIYDSRTPVEWVEGLAGLPRLRVIANALTMLRTCTAAGRACLDFSGPPEVAPQGCIPWYEVPGRASASATIIFGHWAALGLRIGPGILALDTGCVWGGQLTAVRLEDMAMFQERVAQEDRI